MAELEDFKTRAEIERKNMEVVRRWIEEVNVDNFNTLYEELFSRDFKHHVPSNSEPKSYEDYGIPASGNELQWSAIAIFELSDGKIIARWEEVDQLTLFQQMGMKLQ